VHDATTFGNSLKILGLPPMRGKNLAVISRSGGHAVIAADACELSGFNLAQLPETFLREIESYFRASVIRLTNPLDLGDLFDLNLYAQIIERTLQLEDVDGVVFLHTSLSDIENRASRELLERLMQLVEKYEKPVAYYLSSESQEVTYLKQNYNFPIFTQVVETIRALEMSHYYYSRSLLIHEGEEIPEFEVARPSVGALVDRAQVEGRDLLLSEALEALEDYGIPAVPSRIAASIEEAIAAADETGYPVVLKVIAEQISHKSDVGGVQLNLRDGSAVAAAYEEMSARVRAAHPEVEVEGVLVQPMVTGGRELILGGRQDPNFGPVVLVGLGGIFVEIFEEAAVRVAPISEREALEMVESLRGYPILRGARGHKPADVESLVEALLRLAQLMTDFPEIKELDINPLRVFHEREGCRALDARVILNR
jgi:acetyltransferase